MATGVDSLQLPGAPPPPPAPVPENVNATPAGGDGVSRAAVDPSKPVPPAQKDDNKEFLPEKFRGAKDPLQELAKAYKELEAKLGAPKDPPKAPDAAKAEPPKIPDAKTADPKTAEEAVTKAGLDMQALTTEFATKGELSKESLEKLEKAGINKATVDEYVEGQKARVERYKENLSKTVGGPEALNGLFQWAGANLSEAEITVANKALQSMNEAEAGLVLQGLRSKYEAANGRPPNFVQGQAFGSPGVKPFQSGVEVADAMRDPRYRQGSGEYYDTVMARLKVSKF